MKSISLPSVLTSIKVHIGLLFGIVLLGLGHKTYGQISITTTGNYTQNFNALLASGSTTWTNNSTISNWYHSRTGSVNTVLANDGSSNAGNLYSYGTGTNTDRSLGSIGSGSLDIGNMYWGVKLLNNSGGVLNSITVSYAGEQWRNSGASPQTINFSYLVGSPTVTGSLGEFQSPGVAVSSLNFTSPVTGGTAGALDGNLAANRALISHTITGMNVPDGSEFMLRWADPDHTGADHGLAIDDLTISWTIAARPSVTINQAAGQVDPAGADPVNFTVVFSEAVTGFTSSDVLQNAGPAGIVVVTEIAPNNGTTYNVAISGMVVNQDVIATIPAGVVQNQSMLTNTASTSTDNTISFTGACAIVCPQNITVAATSPSGALVTYEQVSPGYCGNLSIPASGFQFPIGTTTVNAYADVPKEEIMYLLSGNQLYKYILGTANISGPIDITITGITSFSVASIDFRPSTGQLYALITSRCHPDETDICGRLYTVNTTTGVATQVGTTTYSSLIGKNQIDFDPVADVIHMIGSEYQTHFTIDPVTGYDTYVGFREGVPGFRGLAFSNNQSSATFSTLYGLTGENKLYTIGGVNGVPTPSLSSVFFVGDLNPNPDDPPVGVTNPTGFDISTRGTAWIMSSDGTLSGINLNTGWASKLGILGVSDIRDIAIEPLALSNPTCSFTITVAPPAPPTITCPGNITVNVSPDRCGGTVYFDDENALTITGAPAPTIKYKVEGEKGSFESADLASFPESLFFETGINKVTVTATNSEGTETCSFTVTVVDELAPIITCPENITVSTDAGKSTATVSFVAGIASNCEDDIISVTSNVGISGNGPVASVPFNNRVFPVGVNTVTITATDPLGNSSNCSFTVTVVDSELPSISCPAPITVSCTSDIPSPNIASPSASDNSGSVTITHLGDVKSNQLCTNRYTLTRTYKATDPSGNSANCTQIITVDDQTAPQITGLTPSKRILAPPNHKMIDVTLDYTVIDNCSNPNVSINITSTEPVNGTGDGDTDPDWEIVDDHHIRLRAERSAQGTGRTYQITVTVNDGCNAPASATTEVVVAHNITSPRSGSSFKVGSTVTFTGEFWDVPGNTHTAKWLIDGNTAKGIVTEPSGSKNGKVTGSYRFTSPGIYKLQMNITDQKGVTTYANTNGDVDAIIVIYDPNGGNTYGGGYFNSPAGALVGSPSSAGKASYGFAMNYFKNSTNPKGETQFDLKVGDFEYNALNFDYLVINKSIAQFKGSGKIIGGQSGIAFTMTVSDGQIDGTGIDKIRLKIYNKNNGKVIYDNQPGASDAALPLQAVGANSEIVIQNTSKATNAAARINTNIQESTTDDQMLDVTAMPNPSNHNFTLFVKTDRLTEKIMMQVTDMYGRVIEVRQVVPGQRIQLGDNYVSGTYIVKLIQGVVQKQIKLVKTSDHY